MYLWIVRLLTLTPSLSSSPPRILSAPQSLFAEAIDRISAAVSVGRRDARRVRLRHRQKSLEAGTVPAKKGLGSDDAQDVPPRRGDGGECDQDDSVEPRHARPRNRAFKDGELVTEQGDLCEQRPAWAKGVRHGGGEHQDCFEHGRAKVTRPHETAP